MARIKYSALVSDMRNKLNGSVLTKCRSGNTVRNKVTPTNRRTTAQQAIRVRMSTLSKTFRTLTSVQIAAWNAAVDNYKTTNIFGDSVRPSGINLFVKLNSNLLLAGKSQITSPKLPIRQPDFSLTTVAVDSVGSSFDLDFSGQTVPAGHTLVITATPAVSQGISNFKGKSIILSAGKTIALGTIDIYSDYVARFGDLTAGLRVNVGFMLVNDSTGQAFRGNEIAALIA